MKTEWEKMVTGEKHNALDPKIAEVLNATKDLLWEYNALRPSQLAERDALLRRILGGCGEKPFVNQPFRCDFGCNIRVGNHFFANFNLTILDSAPVTIGHHVFIGPNVSIYTPCHPIEPEERNTWVEWARPVTIGNNVWIGGSVTILPGVTIGDNCTIGAGSVVVKSIPANTVAAGNPCRVLKQV